MVTIDLDAMVRDPYPTFAELRKEQQWTYDPMMAMWLVTRHADVTAVDEDPETFSAEVPGALMTRSIGLSMLRLEGDAHRRARGAGDTPLRRRSIQRDWQATVTDLVDRHLESLLPLGQADLVADFASPFTGDCLKEVLGLPDATADDIHRWSDAYIAAFTNNTDDPKVWAAVKVASAEASDAVALALERVRAEQDATVVSAMANASPDNPLSTDEIAANIRLMISGGFNDARDAVATLTWLLLTHPDVRARAMSDPAAFERAIDESVRWLTPVGSYPRVVTRDVHTASADLSAGDQVLVIAASANHDETVFAQPEAFDIDRPNLDRHLGFSTGAHYCLGSHLTRAMLRAAVPRLLTLPDIVPSADPDFTGWQFRSPVAVPVSFGAA